MLLGAPLIAQPGADDKSASGPRAALEAPIHDFGALEYGEKVVHDFVIYNDGDKSLVLSNVLSSCGCTVIDFDDSIGPGGTGRLRVELDSREQSGAFAVHVEVETNDLANPRLKMTVKAELEHRVRSRPGYIRYLAYRGSDEGRVSTQTLWSADGGELTITGVESPYAFVATTFRRAREDELIAGVDAPQWKVETLLGAEAPVGRLNASLVVQVEHPVLDEVRIPLVGFVHPVVVARPDDLFFGDVVIGTGVESRLQLDIHSKAGIELLGAETTVPGVLVELGSAESDEGETHYLKVLLTPDLLTGPFRGVIRVRTTSSELPVLEIPISGVAY